MQIDETALYRAIGKNLKARREQQGMSQAWLSGRIGLKRTSITNIESGRQKLSVSALYAMCDALGCELMDILPTIATIRDRQNEEVAIDDIRTTLPRQTAQFVRSLVEEVKEEP